MSDAAKDSGPVVGADGVNPAQPDGGNTVDEIKPEAEAIKKAMGQGTRDGFLGIKVDPEPNEKYTVAGVIKGL